jgi:hypothetical protein
MEGVTDPGPLPYPPPPRAAIADLVRRYLGPERRAGQGVLRYGTPDDELAVLARAGYAEPEIVLVPGREIVVQTADEIVAAQFSNSGSAPHLFGERLPEFEAELRELLARTSASGRFARQTGDSELRIWRKPP